MNRKPSLSGTRKWVTVIVFIFSGVALAYTTIVDPISVDDAMGPISSKRHSPTTIAATYAVMVLVFFLSFTECYRLLRRWRSKRQQE